MEAGASRRYGPLEALPRRVFARAGPRYMTATLVQLAVTSVLVCLVGVITLALALNPSPAAVLVFGLGSAVWFLAESWVVGGYIARLGRPVSRWLRSGEAGDAPAAWQSAAALPAKVARQPVIPVVGGAAIALFQLLVVRLLDLPADQAGLLVPGALLLYLYWLLIRVLGLELSMRPVLERLVPQLPRRARLEVPRLPLRWRLLATLPVISWGTGAIVAAVTTEGSDLPSFGVGVVTALVVTLSVSMLLSLMLADAISGPISELQAATRRVGAGDLEARVPVFSADETGELAQSFNDMVAGLAERERLRDAFGAFVDPTLTERVLQEGTDMRGEEIDLSLLFLDIRGFTTFCERAPATEVVARLNELYGEVVPVILRHGGHANKFIGDGLLAVFGAPERRPDHADRAVAAALEIARLVRERYAGELRVGIGVNSGSAVVGTIGGGGRLDFTVIGDPVNTAARVESATRQTDDDVLITEATRERLRTELGGFEERAPIPLKGKSEPVRLYAPSALEASAAG